MGNCINIDSITGSTPIRLAQHLCMIGTEIANEFVSRIILFADRCHLRYDRIEASLVVGPFTSHDYVRTIAFVTSISNLMAFDPAPAVCVRRMAVDSFGAFQFI